MQFTRILLCGTAIFTASHASAAPDTIGLEEALALSKAALSACEEKGFPANASVVDAKGVVKVVLKSDGTKNPPVAAPKKAATAALYNLPGSVMEPRLKSDANFKAEIEANSESFNAHAGSLPLLRDGKVVGGLAISDVPHDVADACVRQAAAVRYAPSDVIALVEKVADYQIVAMAAGLNPIKTGEGYPNPKGWVQGALFVGLTELADRSHNPRYRQLIVQRGQANK